MRFIHEALYSKAPELRDYTEIYLVILINRIRKYLKRYMSMFEQIQCRNQLIEMRFR